MTGRAVALLPLAAALSALAACGGDEGASPPDPDFATFKRLAVSTRPLSECAKGTEETGPNSAGADDVPPEASSRVVQCVDLPGSAVYYNVYKDEGTREKG